MVPMRHRGGLQAGVPVRSQRFTGLLREFQILAGFLAAAQIPKRYFITSQLVIVLHATLEYLERRAVAPLR